MRRKCGAQLDPEIREGYEFQFEFLADRAVITAGLGKAPCSLALEFPLADAADVGTDHESEDMLGVDAFGVPADREQRCHANAGNPNGFYANRHFASRWVENDSRDLEATYHIAASISCHSGERIGVARHYGHGPRLW